MTAATPATTFNTSIHGIWDLKRLAKKDPEGALSVLGVVRDQLSWIPSPADAAIVEEVLAGPDLLESIRRNKKPLSLLFPTENMRVPEQEGELTPAQLAALPAALQETVANARAEGRALMGWELQSAARDLGFEGVRARRASAAALAALAAQTANPSLQYIQGRVSADENGRPVVKTADGTQYLLAGSEHMPAYSETAGPALLPNWIAGLIEDGEMNLHGELDGSGKFRVEAFALNTDGQYDRFTFGRVDVKVSAEGPTVVMIKSPRGDVEVTDPTFKAKLAALPRLGAILPGAPEMKGDRLVYPYNPKSFLGLGRFNPVEVMPADAQNPRPYCLGDMAYSVFSMKPILLPEGAEARVNHSGRMWVRGDVVLDGEGVAERFEADYLSLQTDGSMMTFETFYPPDDWAVQNAVLSANAPETDPGV